MIFLVVMYGCESWTIKKAEHWRIDAFELWCWQGLQRVPCMARRSNQPILKEISPEYSLEGLMLKLKRQYFGHLMWRTDWLEKILMLGNIEGRRRRGRQKIRWFYGITDSMDMTEQTLGDGDGQEAWGAAVHGVAKSQAQLSDQTTTKLVSGENLRHWLISPCSFSLISSSLYMGEMNLYVKVSCCAISPLWMWYGHWPPSPCRWKNWLMSLKVKPPSHTDCATYNGKLRRDLQVASGVHL